MLFKTFFSLILLINKGGGVINVGSVFICLGLFGGYFYVFRFHVFLPACIAKFTASLPIFIPISSSALDI